MLSDKGTNIFSEIGKFFKENDATSAMNAELHSRVAAFVATTGTTINDFINKAIKNELKHAAIL